MDDAFRNLSDALGEETVETRIAVLMLRAAGADEEVSDDEIADLSDLLDNALELLGASDGVATEEVLLDCIERLEDEDVIFESIDILGEHLPKETLAALVNEIAVAAGVDDLDAEEEGFLVDLVEAWQLDEGAEEDDYEDRGEDDFEDAFEEEEALGDGVDEIRGDPDEDDLGEEE